MLKRCKDWSIPAFFVIWWSLTLEVKQNVVESSFGGFFRHCSILLKTLLLLFQTWKICGKSPDWSSVSVKPDTGRKFCQCWFQKIILKWKQCHCNLIVCWLCSILYYDCKLGRLDLNGFNNSANLSPNWLGCLLYRKLVVQVDAMKNLLQW